MTGGAIHLALVVILHNPSSSDLSAYLSLNFLASIGSFLGRRAIGVLLCLISTGIASTFACMSLLSLIRIGSPYLHRIHFSRLASVLDIPSFLTGWTASSMSSCTSRSLSMAKSSHFTFSLSSVKFGFSL